MSGQPESYLQKISNLRIEENREIWPASTNYRAPHKPLLLMAVVDMIAHGSMAENFVEPSFELIDTFNQYWLSLSPLARAGNLAASFIALEEDGFWKPLARREDPKPVNSIKMLQENYLGAKLATNLFSLLVKEQSRKEIRETLIKTYFAEERYQTLIDVALINHAASLYCNKLLSGDTASKFKTGRGREINSKICRLGFRKAVLELYDHRCAMCGIKMMSPEGQTAVDAIHIIPKDISHNDHLRNGIALCGTCHWAFANGFMGVGEKYQVLISSAARLNGNLPGHLLILTDRIISKPRQKPLWPDQKHLAWHRKNIFRE